VAGSKGRYGLSADKTVLPYLSALENAIVFKGAFCKCPGLLFTFIPRHGRDMARRGKRSKEREKPLRVT